METTVSQDPAHALPGCTVIQSATIFYPLNEVPDLETYHRLAIRPEQVKIHATKTDAGPWKISTPVVIGRNVLKSGALGADCEKAVYHDQPEWLVGVVAYVGRALNAAAE